MISRRHPMFGAALVAHMAIGSMPALHGLSHANAARKGSSGVKMGAKSEALRKKRRVINKIARKSRKVNRGKA